MLRKEVPNHDHIWIKLLNYRTLFNIISWMLIVLILLVQISEWDYVLGVEAAGVSFMMKKWVCVMEQTLSGVSMEEVVRKLFKERNIHANISLFITLLDERDTSLMEARQVEH